MSNERLKAWLDQLEADEQARVKPQVADSQDVQRRIVNQALYAIGMGGYCPLTDTLDFGRAQVKVKQEAGDYWTVRVSIPSDLQLVSAAQVSQYTAHMTIAGSDAVSLLEWANNPNGEKPRPFSYTLTYTAYGIYIGQNLREFSELEAGEFALRLRQSWRALHRWPHG